MITTQRPSISLDGTWEFIPDPERRHDPDSLPAGVPIPVPGAWEAQLREPYGIVHAWYRRRFVVPAEWRVGTLLLRFESAMARVAVWLDRQPLSRDVDGYLPFEIEVGAIRGGTEHELTVAVENPTNVLSRYPAFGEEALKTARELPGVPSFACRPHGKQIWYTSTSGLLGSVVAELAPDQRFTELLALPDLDASRVLVRWRVAGSRAKDDANVILTVVSPSGEETGRATAPVAAGESHVAIADVERWDLWRPAMYQLRAQIQPAETRRVTANAPATDTATVRFGMRSIAVHDGSILLNGRPIHLRGALDQDFWPEGRSNPPSRAAVEAQAARLREMGLNLLRCHLKIPSEEYLDVADEAGFLVWCELPNWTTFNAEAARTARRMLRGMVEALGSHPSVVAWTVINEDWGTDLRHSGRDRHWLRTTVSWLKSIDPTRLVVDNSACETPDGPNFHIRTDLADFHAYRSMPDGHARWRSLIDELARGPDWLWSPHGDAQPTGDEALVLSEFGGWGLARPSRSRRNDGGEPWWWSTGDSMRRPARLERRFKAQRLDRIWADVDALADATQWRQFDRLAAQVRELRRHPSIKGYVITELSDGFWESNGLLDVERRPKAFHDRLAELNAPELLIIDLPRSDLWGGERLACEVILSAFPDEAQDHAPGNASLEWHLTMGDGASVTGSKELTVWPMFDAKVVARFALDIPDIANTTIAELKVAATRLDDGTPAIFRHTLAVVPSALRRSARSRRIRVVDPRQRWSIAGRLASIGHEIVADTSPDVIVASHLDPRLLGEVERGRSVLLLARSSDAIPAGVGLTKPLVVRARHPTAALDSSWSGDWTSVFAWALPDVVPGLPEGGLLGDAHREVFPECVLDGLVAAEASDGVEAGLFAGWIHAPVTVQAGFALGAGHLIVTTFRLAPEHGPIATALLESLVQRAAGALRNDR